MLSTYIYKLNWRYTNNLFKQIICTLLKCVIPALVIWKDMVNVLYPLRFIKIQRVLAAEYIIHRSKNNNIKAIPVTGHGDP
jgi:hypothetical protein